MDDGSRDTIILYKKEGGALKYDLPYGLRFSILGRSFKQQLDERLLEKELTGVQLGVLKELNRLEASGAVEVNQRDLENASHVTHPTMTEILKRLERKGFIRCCQSSHDRRHKCVSATEKAHHLQQELSDMDSAVLEKLSQGLSREQLASLWEMLDIMLDNAFQICKKGCDENDQKTCGKP